MFILTITHHFDALLLFSCSDSVVAVEFRFCRLGAK
jgi:hypothetical protein